MTNNQEASHKAKIQELAALLNANPLQPYTVSTEDDGGGEYAYLTTGEYAEGLTFGYNDPFDNTSNTLMLYVQGEYGGWVEETLPHQTVAEDAEWVNTTLKEYITYINNK